MDTVNYYPKRTYVKGLYLLLPVFLFSTVISLWLAPIEVQELVMRFTSGRIRSVERWMVYSSFSITLVSGIMLYSLLKSRKDKKPEMTLSLEGLWCKPIKYYPVLIKWEHVEDMLLVYETKVRTVLKLSILNFTNKNVQDGVSQVRVNLSRLDEKENEIFFKIKQFYKYRN